MGIESRILTAQAFSSNLLNRSTLEKRDAAFLEHALPHAQILLVSGETFKESDQLAFFLVIQKAQLWLIGIGHHP